MSVQDEPQHVMSRSFSVAFDIDVDAIARFAIDCQMASGTLRTASEDADRALDRRRAIGNAGGRLHK